MLIPDTPCMSETEITLLNKYIPHNGNVLEFGCGGSTTHFFAQGVSRLTSVESDPAWLNALTAYSAQWGDRWTPIHVDIGPVTDFGAPANNTPQQPWLNYHQGCWNYMPDTDFDLILIDGRFRLACLCQSLLQCTNDNVILIVHDFWPRKIYHLVLMFTEQIDQAGTSVVLKRQPGMNPAIPRAVWEKFKFVPL